MPFSAGGMFPDSGRAQSHAQMSLHEAANVVDEALDAIEALAAEIAPAWTENFSGARAVLNVDKPNAGDYADIADYAGFSTEQRQILGAVSAAWVFGGMGSWNDVAPPEAHAGDYEQVSEQLFRALIDAICALANSTFDG
jgi:hypothetical protein